MDKQYTLRTPSTKKKKKHTHTQTILPANGTALKFLVIGKPESFQCMDAILIWVDVMDP